MFLKYSESSATAAFLVYTFFVTFASNLMWKQTLVERNALKVQKKKDPGAGFVKKYRSVEKYRSLKGEAITIKA